MDQRRFGCLADRRAMGIELQRQLGGDAYSRVDRHRRTCACDMVGSRARFRPFECRKLADEGRQPRSPKLYSLSVKLARATLLVAAAFSAAVPTSSPPFAAEAAGAGTV